MSDPKQRLLFFESYEPDTDFPKYVANLNKQNIRVCSFVIHETYLHRLGFRLLVETVDEPLTQQVGIDRDVETVADISARISKLNERGYRVVALAIGNYRGLYLYSILDLVDELLASG
ncbi:MAG: hypothetical protein ABA06_03095 [Parcubacteria bacterium C7867-001]|nr:MAG: hypothetical protein ABA06_03095 [Parcubacteria bacterium C7867-001]